MNVKLCNDKSGPLTICSHYTVWAHLEQRYVVIAEGVGFSAALLNRWAISLRSDRWLALGQDDFPEAW